MRKFARVLLAVASVILLFCFGMLIADKHTLRTQIVRMHVIANSDSYEDQRAKLAVRDAVTQHLNEKLKDAEDILTARQVIKRELDSLEHVANTTLTNVGSNDFAVVSLTHEKFSKREYETFSLPAGIYESLRIQIGCGEGKNWWCVVFPAFCVPDTPESFRSAAVSSGFEQGLTNALLNDNSYELRFFFLDCLGKLENFLNISLK